MKKKPAPDEQKIWYENDPDLGRVKKYRSWAGTLIIWDEMLHWTINQSLDDMIKEVFKNE